MEPSKIGYYFSKLFIEDDETDLVRFTFTGHEKKIKCHKSILAEKSSVFNTMFGSTWTTWADDGSVKMDDQVDFDQYEMFKKFIELVYEIRSVDSLSLAEATSVHFYSHKYQLSDLTEMLLIELKRMVELGITDEPFTVSRLTKSLEFGQLYQLDQFNAKLDLVRLALDVDDPLEFFELSKKYGMAMLQHQVVDHLQTVEPNDSWSLEVSHLVLKALQHDNAANILIIADLRSKLRLRKL